MVVKKIKVIDKDEHKPKKMADTKAVATVNKVSNEYSVHDGNAVLRSPRITEKAAIMAEKNNTYVFNVSLDATKSKVSTAVFSLYKVEPLDVRFVPIRSKRVLSRGIPGKTTHGKKAYVVLKKGQKIENL